MGRFARNAKQILGNQPIWAVGMSETVQHAHLPLCLHVSSYESQPRGISCQATNTLLLCIKSFTHFLFVLAFLFFLLFSFPGFLTCPRGFTT